MSSLIKRVAIVGAGPAGAITVDALAKEDKFNTIRVFERQDKAGGIWYVLYAISLFLIEHLLTVCIGFSTQS